MIQGTILKKKKKATLFKCGFQHMWFHTNYRIYCTPDNHHRNLTHPSNFRFLLHTGNFLLLSESVSADLCSSCIFDLSSGAQQRGKYQSCSFFFFLFFSRSASYSQSACHTDPDQIHCHLASVSAEELNVHHSATGVHCRAVGTLTAIACYGVTDVNYFCHMGAKDKLLLIM